jgi:hypothetical protein
MTLGVISVVRDGSAQSQKSIVMERAGSGRRGVETYRVAALLCRDCVTFV